MSAPSVVPPALEPARMCGREMVFGRVRMCCSRALAWHDGASHYYTVCCLEVFPAFAVVRVVGRGSESCRVFTCDWGTPIAMSIGSDMYLLKLSWTVLSARKEESHLHMFSANPRRRKVWTSRSWLMLSKNSGCRIGARHSIRLGCV